MKEFVIIFVFIIFFIGGSFWWMNIYKPDLPIETSIKSTSLPIASNKWEKIDLEENNNSTTYVLELKHGWLVYRSAGFGAGMAFVPMIENK